MALRHGAIDLCSDQFVCFHGSVQASLGFCSGIKTYSKSARGGWPILGGGGARVGTVPNYAASVCLIPLSSPVRACEESASLATRTVTFGAVSNRSTVVSTKGILSRPDLQNREAIGHKRRSRQRTRRQAVSLSAALRALVMSA